jgi:hypothetical protein
MTPSEAAITNIFVRFPTISTKYPMTGMKITEVISCNIILKL